MVKQLVDCQWKIAGSIERETRISKFFPHKIIATSEVSVLRVQLIDSRGLSPSVEFISSGVQSKTLAMCR